LILVITALVFLSPWRSTPAADTGGISAVAGGVSESAFFILLAVVAVFLIVLILALLKTLERR
jgi:hypothetical protein